MKDINISVIIPCYNGWRYMERCLEALENQTLLPYEVIIVDDCSTDDSYDSLKNYAKNSSLNINIIQNEKNSGPGVSRKNAIAIAKGDYVIFCDCDDWYELEYIEEMTKKICDESADVVICDNYFTYDDRKLVCDCVKPLVGADKKRVIAFCYTSLWRLAIRKCLLERIYMPSIYHGEDAAVVPQILAKANRISTLDKPLYNYYFREDSASKKPSSKAYLEFLEAFKAVEKINPEFENECEFIGIKMVCYGASLNAFKCGISTQVISGFITEFGQRYPEWQRNSYLEEYGKIKKLYVKIISKKMFALCRILALMHYWVVKYKT